MATYGLDLDFTPSTARDKERTEFTRGSLGRSLQLIRLKTLMASILLHDPFNDDPKSC